MFQELFRGENVVAVGAMLILFRNSAGFFGCVCDVVVECSFLLVSL